MLLHHNIKPVLVFDGRNLPSKAGTEKKRRSKRFGQSLIPSYCYLLSYIFGAQEGEQRSSDAAVEGGQAGRGLQVLPDEH